MDDKRKRNGTQIIRQDGQVEVILMGNLQLLKMVCEDLPREAQKTKQMKTKEALIKSRSNTNFHKKGNTTLLNHLSLLKKSNHYNNKNCNKNRKQKMKREDIREIKIQSAIIS